MSLHGEKVTVLGAGVAGLAVARALALRGAAVTVLEQADAIREVGAGLQISPNGATVLHALGLEPELDRMGQRADAVALMDGLDDTPVMRMELARPSAGQGFRFLHRADLIDLLARGARESGVEIRLLQKVKTVDLSGPRPCVTTAQGAEIETDFLIGADGLHSPTRTALCGAGKALFTNQVAWRAVLPADGPIPPVAEVHMGPGRHLVTYPLRGGTLRNIVAIEERQRWAEESWALRDDPMELRLAFRDFGPRVRGWLDQVQDVWLWGLFRHPVARTWTKDMPEGAVAIMGDAAHPTLPFLAQGANMALEDAFVLAQAVDTHADRAEALAAYQAARAPRCKKIVEAANRNARAYHLSGPLRSVAHLGLKIGSTLLPDFALSRFDWIYGHDVTTG